MSQPYDFIDLTSMDLESFTPTQLNQLLNTADTGSPVQPFIKSEPTNDLDFDFFNSYPLPIDSQASTLLTTSDLLGYDLDQTSSGYPTPGPSTPQPYIFEQQQCHNPILAVDLPYRRRPQAFRSQTNTSYIQPSCLPPSGSRRRSLSQGDVGHVAAIDTVNAQGPQATFVRMQTARSRSAVPDANPRKRRAGHRKTRSASQNPNSDRGRAHDDALINVPEYISGLVPTRLGDPISPESPHYHRPAAQQSWPIQDGTGQPAGNQVAIRHLTTREDMERSQKIIEIGVLAVNSGQEDPALQDHCDTILKKLGDVERYLKAKGLDCVEALKGCATIREVLARKTNLVALPNIVNNLQRGPTTTDAPDAPSIFMVAQGHDIFGVGDAEDERWLERVIDEHRSPNFLNEY